MTLPVPVWSKPDREVWLSDCLDPAHVAAVMGDRKADLLCVDAPYSEKTHKGHDAGKVTSDRMTNFAKSNLGAPGNRGARARYAIALNARGQEFDRREIDYPPWAPADVSAFVGIWEPRTAGWIVSLTDHVLAAAWESELEAAGRQTFPPVPLVETGSRVRMAGDGPSNWTVWLVVARPRSREFASWGTLCGSYVVPGERRFNGTPTGEPTRVVGGKPLRAMQAIVRDYSRPGDLVVDPCAGGGTTLRAAIREGRRCIGLEKMPEHAQLSAQACGAERPVGAQGVLFG